MGCTTFTVLCRQLHPFRPERVNVIRCFCFGVFFSVNRIHRFWCAVSRGHNLVSISAPASTTLNPPNATGRRKPSKDLLHGALAQPGLGSECGNRWPAIPVIICPIRQREQDQQLTVGLRTQVVPHRSHHAYRHTLPFSRLSSR